MTKYFKPVGKEVFVNVDCRENGYVIVEVINKAGEIVAVSKPVNGDNIRIPVSWEKQKNINKLVGKDVKFRIKLKNADIYSFWTEKN